MPVLSDRAKEQDSHQSIKTFQIYLILRIIYIASLVLHNLNQGVIPTQGYRKHSFTSIYDKCTKYTW